MHDHRAFARPNQLATDGTMATEPRIIRLAAVVGPCHVVGDWHPWMHGLHRWAYGHHDPIQAFALCKLEKGADHHACVALGAMHGGNRYGQAAEHIRFHGFVARGGLDHPVPSFRREVIRSRAHERDAARHCYRIVSLFVDKAELELGIRIEQLGIILVMGPGVAEIAEIAPRSLLDRRGPPFSDGAHQRASARLDSPACSGLGRLVSAKGPPAS